MYPFFFFPAFCICVYACPQIHSLTFCVMDLNTEHENNADMFTNAYKCNFYGHVNAT